ncbi:hypothetical protein RCCGEPOP_30544 [Rhizobium sp. Pop5]|nr:hypothetical protein RCCGEPOP_30544 [Rhizobium sp. Pop5]
MDRLSAHELVKFSSPTIKVSQLPVRTDVSMPLISAEDAWAQKTKMKTPTDANNLIIFIGTAAIGAWR